jgi:hypothetical protein
MSTTTVSYQSTSQDVELEDLRRREAAAREAARRAAERAEQERRRAEEVRRRIERANAQVAEADENFQRIVAKLDEAASRLPDLTLSAPRLPVLSDDIAQDPARLEVFAQNLQARIERFERQVDEAIDLAERLLQRRIAKAEAWQRSTDLEQQFAQRIDACKTMAARLGRVFNDVVVSARPDSDIELEEVEEYEQALRAQVDALNAQHADLSARLEVRARAATLAGPAVDARDATAAIAEYDDARRSAAREALLRHRDAAMRESRLTAECLSRATCNLIDEALEEAHLQDQRSRVTRWIAQEKQRRDGIERSLALLQSVPELVQDDALLSRRWVVLSGRLQRIAGGLEAFRPDVDREYEQLRCDARRLVNNAYASADWVERMRDEDFEVYEREDGAGLLVVDLDHPEVWLEASQKLAEDGGILTILELKTDTAPADEAQVTNVVCSRLDEVAGKRTPKVATQAEELERKQRITRAIRPAIKRDSSA